MIRFPAVLGLNRPRLSISKRIDQMSESTVKTSVILFGDRYMPPSAIAGQAKLIEASGVVDYLQISDQLVNFIPPQLWTVENAPLSKVLPDLDSCPDAFALASYCLASTPKLGVTVATDSIRRGPAELIQTMLTMSNFTEGKAIFLIGGGEVKQAKPYGWKRSEGLSRMEDLFRIFHALLDGNGPINFEGNHWKFQHAYLGGSKQHRPTLWGLGGGPKLVELATTYCDGLVGTAPCGWATPDEAREHINDVKKMLVAKGRDPEMFSFGMFFPILLHEDPAIIDRALDNPIIRWMAGTVGRIEPQDWLKEGMEPAVPDGWNYFLKMLPYDTSDEFIASVLSKTTRKMAEKGMFWGTPTQVASIFQEYVDAGVNWVLPVDYMPLVLTPEDAATSVNRSIEVCAHLKRINAPKK